jgi:hypothetical protein
MNPIISTDKIAVIVYEATRIFGDAFGDIARPRVEEASEWRLKGVKFGVERFVKNPDITLEEIHSTWVWGMVLAGWEWGRELDVNEMTHPDLVGYNRLSIQQKVRYRLLEVITKTLLGIA